MKNKNNFTYLLSEHSPQRKVYLIEDKIYRIESLNSTDKFKRKYNRFVTETSDTGLFAYLRDRFNYVQALSFTNSPPLISKIFSLITTPTPKISKYGSVLDVGCSSGIFLQYLPDKWKIKKRY